MSLAGYRVPPPMCFCRVSNSDSRTEYSVLSAGVCEETVPTQAALSKVNLTLVSGCWFCMCAQGDIDLQHLPFSTLVLALHFQGFSSISSLQKKTKSSGEAPQAPQCCGL